MSAPEGFAAVVERRRVPGTFGGTEACYVATVSAPSDVSMTFSRYDDEASYLCDAIISGGRPVFVHGDGARDCSKQVAAGWLSGWLRSLESEAVQS